MESQMNAEPLRDNKTENDEGFEKVKKEVDTFLKLMINRLETTSGGDAGNPDLYDDAAEYQEAQKDVQNGDFGKTKKLLRTEMKYAKRGSYFSGDNRYFRTVSALYSKIEEAEPKQK